MDWIEEIKSMLDTYRWIDADIAVVDQLNQDLNRLIAEVERLQADNERLRGLVKQAAYDNLRCPFCGVLYDKRYHESNCPAFSAPGVVR